MTATEDGIPMPTKKLPEPEDGINAQKALKAAGISLIGAAILIAASVVLDSAAAWFLINVVAGTDASVREALAIGIASVLCIASITARTKQ